MVSRCIGLALALLALACASTAAATASAQSTPGSPPAPGSPPPSSPPKADPGEQSPVNSPQAPSAPASQAPSGAPQAPPAPAAKAPSMTAPPSNARVIVSGPASLRGRVLTVGLLCLQDGTVRVSYRGLTAARGAFKCADRHAVARLRITRSAARRIGHRGSATLLVAARAGDAVDTRTVRATVGRARARAAQDLAWHWNGWVAAGNGWYYATYWRGPIWGEYDWLYEAYHCTSTCVSSRTYWIYYSGYALWDGPHTY